MFTVNMFKIREKFPEYKDHDYGGLEQTFVSAGGLLTIVVLGIFGLVGLIITSVLTHIISSISGPQLALLPIGVFVTVVGIAISAMRRQTPKRIVFDAPGQRLYLLDEAHTPLSEAPALSYDALESLSVERRVSTHKNRRSVNYSVILCKRDLAMWTLLSFTSAARAERARNQLLSLMGWSGKPTSPTDVTESDSSEDLASGWTLSAAHANEPSRGRFEVDRQMGRTRISWRCARSPWQIRGLALVLLGLGAVCVGAFALDDYRNPIVLAAAVIAALVVRGMSRHQPERWVEINRDEVRASPRMRLFGDPTPVEVSASDLYGVSFHLADTSQLQLITHEVFERTREARERGVPIEFKYALEEIKLLLERPVVNTWELHASEVLALELLIEEEFEAVHGRALE